jgi:microsomal dipeptidase-like Zn-dependent dipeptidase
MGKPYFDLHLHPTSKSYLSNEREEKRLSPWKMVRGYLLQIIEPILKSQANYRLLHKGHVKLVLCPIVPIEKGFSNNWLIRSLVVIFTVLNKKFLSAINSDFYSYSELFWGELEHARKHAINPKTRQEVKLLKSFEEYRDDHTTNNDRIYGVLAIEGSHALKHRTGDYTYFENLSKIKNLKDVSFLYLTLTHLNWNDICNHAYGSALSGNRVFWPHPEVRGISKAGIEIIKESYSTSNGKRILIDIKHMSAVARQQFYDLRKVEGFQEIPLLATHMGLAGYPLADLKSKFANNPSLVKGSPHYTCVSYEDIKGIGEGKNNETHFNRWSINLFDEDIIEIVNSNGLIGISMDERILGFGKKNVEYFRTDELCELTGLSPGDLEHDDPCDESYNPRSGRFGRKRKHFRYLCNNILHAVKIGGPKAWKHICLGSDFDGLINPINGCKTVAHYHKLEEQLVVTLEEMSNETPGVDYHITNLQEQVRDFMFNNGERFLSQYFTKSYLETGILTSS